MANNTTAKTLLESELEKRSGNYVTLFFTNGFQLRGTLLRADSSGVVISTKQYSGSNLPEEMIIPMHAISGIK